MHIQQISFHVHSIIWMYTVLLSNSYFVGQFCYVFESLLYIIKCVCSTVQLGGNVTIIHMLHMYHTCVQVPIKHVRVFLHKQLGLWCGHPGPHIAQDWLGMALCPSPEAIKVSLVVLTLPLLLLLFYQMPWFQSAYSNMVLKVHVCKSTCSVSKGIIMTKLMVGGYFSAVYSALWFMGYVYLH